MRYPIAIEPGSSTHAFGVVFPDLKGCFSAGDTLEEALTNAKEAASLWLEETLNAGHSLPKPSGLEKLTKDPKFKGWVFALIDIDPAELSGKTERINITLPSKALRHLDYLAQKAGKTRSGYLSELIYTAQS